MFTNYGSGLSSFQSNLVHYHPIWSILVQFSPLWSTLIHFNQIQSTLVYSLKNEKRQFWVKNAISYLNYIIIFYYQPNLLKRLRNLNNKFET